MKLVKESLNEFERGLDPKTALGIGRIAKIQKLFRDLDIPDKYYTITPTEVILNRDLNLSGTNVTWLPDNLSINGILDLENSLITKLPNNLEIRDNLWLSNSLITELPNDLQVGLHIYVRSHQKQLIKFIKNSSFANKLKIW
jgi:hypothetical protein